MGVAIGLLVGVAAAAVAALSGGPVMGGRLDTVGPSAPAVGLFAALEIGGAAVITALAIVWHRRRSAATAADFDSEATVEVAAPGRFTTQQNWVLQRVRRARSATALAVTWLPRRLRRHAPSEVAAPLAVDLTEREPVPDPAPAVDLVKQPSPAAPIIAIADDEPTDEFVPPRDLAPPPDVAFDEQLTTEIPVIRDSRRHPHLPKRLRRKSKEIKLPE